MGDGDTAWFIGNTINDNVAPGDGGGLMWDDDVPYGSTLYFEGNELLRNRSGQDGGGCYFDDDWSEGGLVVFDDNQVNRNVARRDYGGCYFDGLEEKLVSMANNAFNHNTAGRDFGGIYFDEIASGSQLDFWNNQIIGNQAGISGTQVLGGDGGGLWFDSIDSGSAVDMRHNVVLSNTAHLSYTAGITPSGGSYGGIYTALADGSLLTMSDNEINSNRAGRDFGGVSLELDDASRVLLTHNLIQANDALSLTAGVAITGGLGSQVSLSRNRILDHQAAEGYGIWVHNVDPLKPLAGSSENDLIAGSSSGGLYLQDAAWQSTNDTVTDNGSYGIWMTGTLTTTAQLANTILWNHDSALGRTSVPTYTARFTMTAATSDIQGNWPGAGNLDLAPLFVGAGDYRLQATSPLVESGDTVVAPAIDLDGMPRPVPVGGQADIGAYEWFRAGVQLAPAVQAATGLPGAQVTHTLTITNDGNAAGWFAFDVLTATLGWPAVVPTPIWLAAGDSGSVALLVTVPAGALAEATDTLTVQASAQHDSAVIAPATVETTAGQVAGVALTPDGSGGGFIGSTVVHAHTISNQGNGHDTFSLAAACNADWPVRISPATVTLAAGESATVLVYVTVPALLAGQTTATSTVTATSGADSAVQAVATDTTVGYPWPHRVYLPFIIWE